MNNPVPVRLTTQERQQLAGEVAKILQGVSVSDAILILSNEAPAYIKQGIVVDFETDFAVRAQADGWLPPGFCESLQSAPNHSPSDCIPAGSQSAPEDAEG